MLTDRGHYTLVQSNSTSVPRATITLPALSQRILGSPFKEKAAVGRHVDLSEDASFAALVRQHLYSPRPVAQHSFAKARIPKYALAQQQLTRRPSTSDGLTLAMPSSPKSHSPHTRPYSSDYKDTLHWPHSPVASPKPSPFGRHADASDKTTATFSVVDIEPSIVNFHMVTAKQTYHFPVKVHNVGTKQERFRIRSLTVKSGGVECLQAAEYDKDKAKLAPGLRATVTLIITFAAPGPIQGVLDVETPTGKGGVALIGTVVSN
ncbi:hypothetical protein DYB32_007758 [Aphanomyces invadans]|uniref:Uncharacterized protein n=1 Tax=Aphanomyces invadans TaxID=157072 RepID=A0A418ANL0_9STRA|nr:hypothetical protein DYB32_007758 [Aphanomyces invadans]